MGYIYTGFRHFPAFDLDTKDAPAIWLVRDPRDILVSGYYSITYSHGVPSKGGNKHDSFMASRLAKQESTIDEYAISESDRVYDYFSRYQTLLLDRYKNAYVTQYEEMVSNFEAWLTDLLNYCELNLSREFIQYLIEENEAKKPKVEDITKHIRKGVVGDYKEKLQPETIQTLNERFAPILERFHYQQS